MLLFLILISVLPVYILGNKIYKNDYEKEPRKLLIKLFLYGILSVIMTLVLSGILELIFPFFSIENDSNLNILSLIIYVFVGVALIEELSKWILVYNSTYNHMEFNHAYDAIVYATFVSLGFACIENILYVMDGGIQTALVRSISAVPGHVSFGIFMGYFIALAKIADSNNNVSISKKNKILSLVVPIVLHGVYDYLIYATAFYGFMLIIFIVFVIWMFIAASKKVKQLANITYNIGGGKIQPMQQVTPSLQQYGYNFCPVCGDRVRGNFCRVCGHQHNKVN